MKTNIIHRGTVKVIGLTIPKGNVACITYAPYCGTETHILNYWQYCKLADLAKYRNKPDDFHARRATKTVYIVDRWIIIAIMKGEFYPELKNACTKPVNY